MTDVRNSYSQPNLSVFSLSFSSHSNFKNMFMTKSHGLLKKRNPIEFDWRDFSPRPPLLHLCPRQDPCDKKLWKRNISSWSYKVVTKKLYQVFAQEHHRTSVQESAPTGDVSARFFNEHCWTITSGNWEYQSNCKKL